MSPDTPLDATKISSQQAAASRLPACWSTDDLLLLCARPETLRAMRLERPWMPANHDTQQPRGRSSILPALCADSMTACGGHRMALEDRHAPSAAAGCRQRWWSAGRAPAPRSAACPCAQCRRPLSARWCPRTPVWRERIKNFCQQRRYTNDALSILPR